MVCRAAPLSAEVAADVVGGHDHDIARRHQVGF
jgi:hypothetical protein